MTAEMVFGAVVTLFLVVSVVLGAMEIRRVLRYRMEIRRLADVRRVGLPVSRSADLYVLLDDPATLIPRDGSRTLSMKGFPTPSRYRKVGNDGVRRLYAKELRWRLEILRAAASVASLGYAALLGVIARDLWKLFGRAMGWVEPKLPVPGSIGPTLVLLVAVVLYVGVPIAAYLAYRGGVDRRERLLSAYRSEDGRRTARRNWRVSASLATGSRARGLRRPRNR